MQILIIDDTEFKYDLLSSVLTSMIEDVKIDIRTDLNTGLKALHENKYDIVFIDNHFPVYTGKTISGRFAELIINHIDCLNLDTVKVIYSTDYTGECNYDFIMGNLDIRIIKECINYANTREKQQIKIKKKSQNIKQLKYNYINEFINNNN